MRIIKRAGIVVAGLLLVVVAGSVLLFGYMGRTGQSPVEAWIGGQLRGVVNGYLVPELDFDELDYQAPLTVELTNLRLTADDPDSPGSRIDFIQAQRARLTLEELPREGRPLRIKTLELTGARVRLIESKSGRLIGFDDFVQSDPDADAPPLSEVLRVTRVELQDGAIEYDSRQPGTDAMVFEGIDTAADINPSEGGRYELDINLARKPVFDANIQATLDLDAMALDIKDFVLAMRVNRQQDRYLPPQVQAVLKEYDIIGDLSVQAGGRLSIDAWAQSKLYAKLELKDGYAMAGDYRLPIDRLSIDTHMADQQIEVRRLVAELLSGEVRGDGVIKINESMDADFHLGALGLDIEQTLKPMGADQAARYAGKLDFNVSAKMPLDDPLHQMVGQGDANIRDARIAHIPVISDVIEFMESRGDLRRDKNAAGRDRGEMAFELRGDHAYLDKFEIVGSWFAMRGKGRVFFDNRLDMNVNAGPMQKVQSALGVLGDVFGAITDGLIAYRVSGGFDDPKVGVAPLSGIIGAPGERERRRDREDESDDAGDSDRDN